MSQREILKSIEVWEWGVAFVGGHYMRLRCYGVFAEPMFRSCKVLVIMVQIGALIGFPEFILDAKVFPLLWSFLCGGICTAT